MFIGYIENPQLKRQTCWESPTIRGCEPHCDTEGSSGFGGGGTGREGREEEEQENWTHGRSDHGSTKPKESQRGEGGRE